MINRRGQGISINMIIIATIGILVLIVAVFLVSKGGKNVNEATGSCLAQGGSCKAFSACTGEESPVTSDESKQRMDCQVGEVCCRYNFGG